MVPNYTLTPSPQQLPLRLLAPVPLVAYPLCTMRICQRKKIHPEPIDFPAFNGEIVQIPLLAITRSSLVYFYIIGMCFFTTYTSVPVFASSDLLLLTCLMILGTDR